MEAKRSDEHDTLRIKLHAITIAHTFSTYLQILSGHDFIKNFVHGVRLCGVRDFEGRDGGAFCAGY